MPVTKRIVCLANSRKLQGRCVAGRVVRDDGTLGEWIRPVSARQHEEVSERERMYEDGSDPQVLDIIDVPLLEPRPKAYQQENWLLDPDHYWARTGLITWDELIPAADTSGMLWINGFSTWHGSNDRIPLENALELTDSLRLIHAPKVNLMVSCPDKKFGDTKRRVQAMFKCAGVPYGMWVTDPKIEKEFLAQKDGLYQLGECLMTISLGEPHEGFAYKLAATIIRKPS